MNQTELEKLAVEIITDIASQEGEPLYVIDHKDLQDYFDGNVEDEVFAEILELIPNVNIDKFNEMLIPIIEDELINKMF